MKYFNLFKQYHFLGLTMALLLASCKSAPPPVPATQSRVIQTRIFEASNQQALMHAILITLQDSGYNIVKVNLSSYEVSAQKGDHILLSVMTYPYNKTHFAVRVNAQKYQIGDFIGKTSNYVIITDPTFYQINFFDPLSKTLFLQKE